MRPEPSTSEKVPHADQYTHSRSYELRNADLQSLSTAWDRDPNLQSLSSAGHANADALTCRSLYYPDARFPGRPGGFDREGIGPKEPNDDPT
jgi:hypothetical protein